MIERLSNEQITRVNLAITKTADGIDVRFIYDKSRLKMREAMFLANDAIARKSSIIDGDL